jgi:hypothetical protein
MRSLKALQTDFQAYVLRQQAGIQAEILGTQAVTVDTRLDIYRHGYYLRLLEVLGIDYPGLRHLLGDHEFELLVRRYSDAQPSTFRSLRWYGDQLAAFLKTTAPYAKQPLLTEMADFEWHLMAAFDATDAPVVAVETMTTIPMERWAEMYFTIHPAVKRLALQWNITALWHAYDAAKKVQPECFPAPIAYVIWRQEYDVQFCSLSVEAAYLLDAMAARQCFGAICEGLCEWFAPHDVAMQAASLLKRFIVAGVVQAVHY